MWKISILLAIVLAVTFSGLAQNMMSEENFRVFDKQGNPATLNQIIDKLKDVDVVFLGENHDDATGHSVQLDIFKKAFAKYGSERQVALSLEMFERDTQAVVDEYLQDLITEKQFLSDARPWNNYETDYKPLVEFAKEHKLPVIAANAPRRYVNRVTRLGRDSLNILSPTAKSFLAPLPYNSASEIYTNKFNGLMGAMAGPAHAPNKILDAQSLWDATMAFSMAEFLKKQKKSLIVQLNGGFHSESRLGTPEHLLKYQPKARFLVVTIKYDGSFPNFDKTKQENIGDFVIITNPNVPRSNKKVS